MGPERAVLVAFLPQRATDVQNRTRGPFEDGMRGKSSRICKVCDHSVSTYSWRPLCSTASNSMFLSRDAETISKLSCLSP